MVNYSLDGGVTWLKAESVRVSYDVVVENYEGEEKEAELVLNCTDEGQICDVIGDRIASSSETAQEITDRLVRDA